MNRAVIVLNAGSSSLKFSLYQIVEHHLRPIVRGQFEGLGTRPSYKATDPAGAVLARGDVEAAGHAFGHAEALTHLVSWLRDQYAGRLSLAAVGHRVLHGGADFVRPTLITPDVLEKLQALVPLVPLHQPHNLAAVRAVSRLRPDLPQVACFDTAFHQRRARVTERFAIPDRYFHQGVRRWGFHGLSYESVSGSLRQLSPQTAAGRVVIAHLGSGASMCAVRDGHCVDTTMSFSALDGLPMGTRCGALDPGVLLHLLNDMSRADLETMLYRESGLLGISGISNDVRDLLASDDPRAAEALDYFVYHATRQVASLAAALGGIDALVFTAGVGENSPVIRRRICHGLAFLGIAIDDRANLDAQQCISAAWRAPSVWVLPTDEEATIASHTAALLHETPDPDPDPTPPAPEPAPATIP